jgi:hypothetical protein
LPNLQIARDSPPAAQSARWRQTVTKALCSSFVWIVGNAVEMRDAHRVPACDFCCSFWPRFFRYSYYELPANYWTKYIFLT